jgi:hypothetical protein
MKKIEKLDYSKMVDDILEIIDTDFCMDMECKIEEKEYSQSEAETMARIISAVYKIAHCSYCNACNRKYQSQKQPEGVEYEKRIKVLGELSGSKAEGTKCEYCGKVCEQIYHCDWGWVCEEHCFENPFKKPEKQEEWEKGLEDIVKQWGDGDGSYIGTLPHTELYDFIKQLLSERTEEILDKFWGDDELQKAIYNYGEWNDTKLNEAFKKVKSKLLEK